MQKIVTKLDGASTKEFVKGSYLLGFAALGVGLICLVLYVVFGVINNEWFIGLNLVTLISGTLLLVLAIALLLILNSAIKKANDFERTITYEFDNQTFSYIVSRNERIVENGNLPYSDLTEFKETKNYVYVGLKNGSWFAIQKSDGLVDFLISKGLKKFRRIKFNK